MNPVYVLCRPRDGVAPAAVAAALLDADATVLQPFDAAARQRLVEALARREPALGPPEIDGDSVLLSSRERCGIDVRIEPDRLLLLPLIERAGPAAAEALFARLHALAAALIAEEGLACFVPAVGRLVDLESDHELLARAWLRHCTETAAAEVEATRRGSAQSLIAAAVMLALLVALLRTPAGPDRWAVLLVVVGLPLAVLILWRWRLARRRGQR